MNTGGSNIPWVNFLVRVFVQLATFNEGAEMSLNSSKAAIGSVFIVLNFLRSEKTVH